ncbi:Lrp/AsnC family transcriptional regulator [Candidatus Woesearchaeota archaeon]|nr:Lrp/AsnC family transcriptional regulator [Candidatus Woesearchaeota archaeon]
MEESEKYLNKRPVGFLMDKKDLKLLQVLDADVRIPISVIAQHLGLTENAIRYRIDRLQKRGYLRGFSVKLSPNHFGKNIEVVFSINVRPDSLASSLQKLSEFSEFTKVYRCSGEYSIVCIGLFNDNEQLNDFLNRKLLVEVPVTDWAEHIILKSYKNDEFNVKMISNSNPNLFI